MYNIYMHGLLLLSHHALHFLRTFWLLVHLFLRYSLKRNLIQLVKMLIFFFLALHLLTCGYALLSVLEGFGSTELTLSRNDSEKWFAEQYVICFYAIMNFTVRDSCRNPSNLLEHVFVITYVIIGVLLIATVISSVTQLLRSLNAQTEEHVQQMLKIGLFLDSLKIPAKTKNKVRRYLDYMRSIKNALASNDLIAVLPSPLQQEIGAYANWGAVNAIPIFAGISGGAKYALM